MRDNPVERAVELNADVIIPRLDRLSEDLVNFAHEQNLLVFPWTPDKEAHIQDALAIGADGIITEIPAWHAATSSQVARNFLLSPAFVTPHLHQGTSMLL